MGTLLGAIGLVVAVPLLAVTLVLVRQILQGEVYGDDAVERPAVLRTTGERRAVTARARP
jgi:predicted PurR-regulated permease PerM